MNNDKCKHESTMILGLYDGSFNNDIPVSIAVIECNDCGERTQGHEIETLL